MRTTHFRRLLLAAFFVVPPVALLWPVLTGSRLTDELIHYLFFQGQAFLAWDLGQLPNWWPSYFSGYPISLTLNGFLNPLFLIVLKFVPPVPAHNLLNVLFWMVTIWSGYALARKFGVSRIGSLIAALAWGYGGIIVEWADVVVFTTLYPVLPLSFLACLNIHEGKRWWRWVWAIMLAYAWIGGFSEILVYFLVGIGAFCLMLLGTKPAYTRAHWRRAPGKTAWAFLKDGFVSYALPVLVSLLIVSPWMISVVYFVLVQSNRGAGMTIADASTAQLTLSHFIHTILPRLDVPYGGNIPILRLNPNDYHYFIGTIPLLLLLLLPFLRNAGPRYARRFFLGLLAFGLLIAWRSPLYLFLHSLPILKWFSQHSKWSYLTLLALSMLAGFATDAFLHAVSPRHRTPKRIRILKRVLSVFFGLWAMGIAALGTITLFAKPLETAFFHSARTRYARVAENLGQALPRAADYYDTILHDLSHALVRGFSFADGWTLTLMLLWGAALAALAFPIFRPQQQMNRVRGVILGVALVGSTIPWVGMLVDVTPDYLTTEPATVRWLHEQEPYRSVPIITNDIIPYRVFTYIPEQTYAYIREQTGIFLRGTSIKWFTREALENNVTIWFEIDGSFNHEPLADQAILDYRNEIMGARGTTTTQAFQDQVTRFSSDHIATLLGEWNVKYVLTPLELGEPWLPVFASHDNPSGVTVFIYQNPFFRPRWSLANAGDLSLVHYTAGWLELQVQTNTLNRVVFRESASPFWRVSVDGQPADIVRTNGAFLGVDVPPGTHTVVFRYPGFWEQAQIALTELTKRMR